jgi:hypothetical protein
MCVRKTGSMNSAVSSLFQILSPLQWLPVIGSLLLSSSFVNGAVVVMNFVVVIRKCHTAYAI